MARLLHRPESRGVQGRHFLQSPAQVVCDQELGSLFPYEGQAVRGGLGAIARVAYPLGECRGCVERKDLSATGIRVQAVRELGFRAGALVQKRERTRISGEIVRQARAVLSGLDLDSGERGPFRLGFDDARCLLVHIEQVVGAAVPGLQGKLAHRHAAGGVQVDGIGVLDGPPGLLQQSVNVYASLFFGSHYSTTVLSYLGNAVPIPPEALWPCPARGDENGGVACPGGTCQAYPPPPPRPHGYRLSPVRRCGGWPGYFRTNYSIRNSANAAAAVRRRSS